MSIQHLINAYTPETKESVFSVAGENDDLIEVIKVIHVQNNSLDLSKSKALELLKLLDGSFKMKLISADGEDGEQIPDYAFDFTKIASNLSSPSMKGVEDFVQKNCKMFIKDKGEWVQVDTAKKAEIDYVFTKYADQYFNFLIDGVKFHFLKFLPSGTELLTNLANQAANRFQLENLKPKN